MGKITKTMQPKHRDTLSPWLKEFVHAASSLPLPLIPKKLEEFPSRWPFPRGDLYHWIDLLNRFDNILESFCETYDLTAGPQTKEFGLEVLSGRGTPPVDYRDEKPWDASRLAQEGYQADGDRHLVISILKFTCMLLERCGNRSIYASSAHLNNLLNSTCLDVVAATLRVSLELAQRYQASVKRMTSPTRQVSTALLANHYNIELDRVQCLAQPFVKTPIIRIPEAAPTTPASAGKGKEKAPGSTPKNVASMYANDLVSIVMPGPADDDRWHGWGDLKMVYYPKLDDPLAPVPQAIPDRHPSSTTPSTPTPLRRSSTGAVPPPRSSRLANTEDGPPPHTPGHRAETQASSGVKSIEFRASTIQSTSIYDLLAMCPDDMPKSQRYEYLNRLRICKALVGSAEERQEALAVRLLAITNLAYIHLEPAFIEKALKQDNDEPRRFQLVYQLAELIHPSVDGIPDPPRWLQSIAMSLLEAIVPFSVKYPDILSALNANVNHGVLLYVIRKAVAEMKEDPADDTEGRLTEQDRWRDSLFSLTQSMAMASRIGQDMAAAGLMDILVEMLNIRSKIASRNYSMVIGFLDNLVYLHQGTFQMLTNASGLDSIANLIIHTVSEAKTLVEAGRGTRPEFHASLVDYAIPFYQQQTLKWLLKFIHHVMTNAFAVWGNTDRLLRNLVDNSALLGSLRSIIKDTHLYGSVVWTNAAALLSDFINNDPTSFTAISESGMIQTFLETLTGRPVVVEQPSGEKADAHEDEDDSPSPSYSDDSVTLESDDRPHPPTQAVLEAPREIPLAQGILPSAEAISAIPSVLNSLSLNNSGMKMVVASRALESFLEIFESAPHIHCMEADPEMAVSVGNSFDELSRHHPALRPAISNAILDMVARIVHLSKSQALVDVGGAKLQITDPNGIKVTADRALLGRSPLPGSGKGKEKIGDDDIDMADASVVLSPKPKGLSSQHGEITRHIWAVSTFLSAVAGTTTLKTPFIREGGIELLLDLMVAPSLPSGFGDTSSSKALSQVTAQLIEASQITGLPSLLNRIQDTLQELQPLVNRDKSHPFFAPFIIPDLSKEDAVGNWNQTVRKVADGTPVVKALVNLQTLIRTLYQTFPYSSRTFSVSLPMVNVYDMYTRVIEGMGPILEEILIEEMEIGYLVPPHWTKQKTKVRASVISSTASGSAARDAEDAMVPDVVPISRSVGGVEPEDATEVKSLSGEEAASTQFGNFHNLCGLLHSMLPSALPFFQNLGRALLSRRSIDHYTRGHQVGLTSVLAHMILKQLRPKEEEPSHKDFHYWIVMFHTIHEVLIDSGKPPDRSGSVLIAPVLAAFKEHGGFEVLNAMLQKFADVVCKAGSEGEEANKAKMAAVSMKKILEIYSVVVNGKNVVDSVQQTALARQESPGKEYGHLLVVELRMIILPVIRKLWESEDLIAKSSTEVLGKIIDILKAIAGADNEAHAPQRSDNTKFQQIFKDRKPPALFAWTSATYQEQVRSLTASYGDQGLAQEAVYRAIGKPDDAAEYCRAHLKGVAGKRNPIPEAEAYQPQATPKDPKGGGADPTPAADPMALDSVPADALPAVISSLLEDETGQGDMDSSEEDPSDSDDDEGTASPTAADHDASEVAVGSTSVGSQPPSAQSPPAIAREDLDEERGRLRKDLIDRCLDVIRAHPDSVFEVADLIDKSILKGDSEDKRTEVGDVLANALMSFAFNDEEDRKVSGPSIAAYAHLLSLLLRDKAFFKATVPTLKENINEYLEFLKLPSAHSSDELSPWIPYVLLIFELLLADDALPVEAKWKPPTGDDDEGELPVLVPRESNLSADNKNDLLTAVLEILPRIGKEEALAISVLRILVILTRDRRMAKTVGDKRNLQRLFLMAKQLCGVGAGRLKQSRVTDSIMIVLRHIVEDEKTIRQVMQSEIRQYLSNSNSQRNGRAMEIVSYLRHLSHAALRDPELFVQVTVETAKLYRYSPPTPGEASAKHVALVLRDQLPDSASPAKDSSIDPAVQATSDLTISDDKATSDVKLTTEPADKEMPDAPKTPGLELKRPNLTDPDGVVHFLLCELLNYRDVEDKELSTLVDKEPRETPEASSSSADLPSQSAKDSTSEPRDKDKKTSKPVFKSEEHPIFMYRCFLLDCLAELLQCFNRAKVEFINFKRSAPVQNSTPIKPRTSVLNYLLSDLLCFSHTPTPLDSITIKKKAATSHMAASVLVSLVTRTGEKLLDRSSDNFAYDDEPDLLFVRRFVLDTILRAYKDASVPSEPFEIRYQRMVCLAELMSNMIGEKDKDSAPTNPRGMDPGSRSHAQLKRLMFEKGYLAAMTASIADIDLTFPNVKRTIKYILRVLRALTKTGFELSQSEVMPITNADQPEDDFASSSSLSDVDDDREETPDLYRNSTLGMLEPGGEDDFSEGSDDDDEDMYDGDQYDEELDYGDEMSQDGEDNPSDDEDEELGEMGPIEGLSGEPGVVEVIMGENEDDDDDDDMDEDDDDEPSDEDDDDEDDDLDSDDMEELEDQIQIVDEEGNALADDGGSGWESDEDDEHDEEDEEEMDYEAAAQDIDEAHVADFNHARSMGHIGLIRAAMAGDEEDARREWEAQLLVEGAVDGYDLDEDDEDEEEDVDDELYYNDHPRDEHAASTMPASLGWDINIEPTTRLRGPGGTRSPFPNLPAHPFMIGGGPRGDPYGGRSHIASLRTVNALLAAIGRRMGGSGQADNTIHADHHTLDFRSFIRAGTRPVPSGNDGVNPLLVPTRAIRDGDPSPRDNSAGLVRIAGMHSLYGNTLDGPLAFINDLVQSLPPPVGGGRPTFSLRLGSGSGARHIDLPMMGEARQSRPDSRREAYQDPAQSVNARPKFTVERWQAEANIVFSAAHQEKAIKLQAEITGKLVPEAMRQAKEAKKKKEEELRKMEEENKRRLLEDLKVREAKEAEEKAAKEKKDAEERERAERERAEAAAAAPEQPEAPPAEPTATPQAMEGVESHPPTQSQPAAPPTERVVTVIRGETVDITELGIDPDYLAALPEEFREEVIAQTVSTRRSQAREQAAAEGENTEVFQEFLEALPDELRMEIVQQERQERRRREREDQRRQAAAAGQDSVAADMDPASILMTFPEALREQVLLDQGDDLMEHLPPALAAEARALAVRHGLHPSRPQPTSSRSREAARQVEASGQADSKPPRRSIVQMLDKAGVATLLRLMFVAQQGSIRNYLFEVFQNVCENRQNRLEVISSLLQILQDGSTDMDAVERSFSHLSLKAKQPREKDPKTPNSNLKRTVTFNAIPTTVQPISTNSDVSPLLIVQQCLDLLVSLTSHNPHVASLFLTEHEIFASTLKRSLSRRGKSKDQNNKAHRFAINSLLSLLDRSIIMESSSVMQHLADLLNRVTFPLQNLGRRKEAEELAKKLELAAAATSAEAPGDSAAPSDGQTAAEPVAEASATVSTEEPATGGSAQPDTVAESSTAKETKPEEKKVRQLTPPTVSEHNLKLVINIFVARECSSKTFQNTISTIKNLSNIPGAKKLFGEELVRQARVLSENILTDLDELLPHILKAESGTEIQGVALAKFSPGASEQNKLLRVLTALDHLFDNKGKKSGGKEDIEAKESTKEDLLGSLYWNPTFGTMWDKLSACLSAIRQRENMLNVATILLPLIESLMVVCKNTTLTESALSQSKEMLFSSPPPENRIAGLFFTFTEEHRRILNELVRHTPKLMSGTFSLLVKNPKVLEFDNKRNYFNRSVHNKASNQQSRSTHGPLQLQVRREHVFHDSFKALYFKSGSEMKFGKLNIRFHGEEGVDAGGVTREWFQVLARQMFDPNYALFIPVSSDRTTFHPNKLSGINDEHLMFFKFIGRVIGKALYEGRLLDCYFSRAVYKRILGKAVSVKDMESFDPDYYKSLVWMLENDITDIIVETFSVEDDEFGATKVVDLIENGRNIQVTEDNKNEYVRLIVEHKLLSSVKVQMEHFLKGFHEIIPEELIAIFNEQELELLISGLPDIDVDDWKSNTEYHNYTAASQQIQWFWRAVRSFDKEERAKLLQFVTGTSKVPLNGFKELEGMNGVSRFNIHRDFGHKDRLPSSHTCFNQLDLPEYESYDILRSQILKAITAGSDYFGFA
ncbi:E3 ubiquitin protein ligase [Podospora conica]|nr:E3 ubiquitin protein ligase [Schizothecium conicum]